jgi:hypothetical protein
MRFAPSFLNVAGASDGVGLITQEANKTLYDVNESKSYS